MIECRLAILMAEKKLKLADVVRDTGIPRGTLTRLYKETAVRIDVNDINTLCKYFECDTQALLRYTPNDE